jgi:hypothetical protein
MKYFKILIIALLIGATSCSPSYSPHQAATKGGLKCGKGKIR